MKEISGPMQQNTAYQPYGKTIGQGKHGRLGKTRNFSTQILQNPDDHDHLCNVDSENEESFLLSRVKDSIGHNIIKRPSELDIPRVFTQQDQSSNEEVVKRRLKQFEKSVLNYQDEIRTLNECLSNL